MTTRRRGLLSCSLCLITLMIEIFGLIPARMIIPYFIHTLLNNFDVARRANKYMCAVLI
jgi:hypothetical protein